LRGLVHEGLALLDQGIRQVRSLSLELRPSLLDDLGLLPALRWYTDRQAERAGFAVELHSELGDARLPPDVETTCYRIVQEAVTNVARHAGARRLRVEVRVADGALELLLQDDGRGFDVEAARARAALGDSFGLVSMEERVSLAGGVLRVDSAPGRGTTLRVRLPLAAEATAAGVA
jgi:signal transduction histidine kinase